jgi:hypothetical protein
LAEAKYLMREWINLLESAATPLTLYHITDKGNFKLNPEFEPTDNAISISDRSGNKGIYLTPNVEKWVNGHGYIRAFVAEISVDPSALEHDRIGRYGGEIFIPASQFDKLRVNRVIPIDALCREEFGLHGWTEQASGIEFDTGQPITAKNWEQPFRGWTYPHDTRKMPADEVRVIKQRFKVGLKARSRG